MTDIRLQSVEREDDLPLLGQPGLEALLVGQLKREQCFIPVELLGDATFTDRALIATPRSTRA